MQEKKNLHWRKNEIFTAFYIAFFSRKLYYGYQIKVGPDWRQRNCHLETVLSLAISKSEGESMQKYKKTHIKEKQQ